MLSTYSITIMMWDNRGLEETAHFLQLSYAMVFVTIFILLLILQLSLRSLKWLE